MNSWITVCVLYAHLLKMMSLFLSENNESLKQRLPFHRLFHLIESRNAGNESEDDDNKDENA